MYHVLLVSTDEDIILLAGKFCKQCIEDKLNCKIIQSWVCNDVKDWMKLKVRGIKNKCSC